MTAASDNGDGGDGDGDGDSVEILHNQTINQTTMK